MSMLVRYLTVLIICLHALPSALAAKAQSLPFQIELLEEGQYRPAGDIRTRPSESAAAGRVGEHHGMQHISGSRQVEAKLGAIFGVIYRVRGLPEGATHGFQMRVLHPPMQSSSGGLSTTSTASVVLHSELGSAYSDVMYRLSEPRELLPGTWTVQVLYRGNVVLSREFVLMLK